MTCLGLQAINIPTHAQGLAFSSLPRMKWAGVDCVQPIVAHAWPLATWERAAGQGLLWTHAIVCGNCFSAAGDDFGRICRLRTKSRVSEWRRAATGSLCVPPRNTDPRCGDENWSATSTLRAHRSTNRCDFRGGSFSFSDPVLHTFPILLASILSVGCLQFLTSVDRLPETSLA